MINRLNSKFIKRQSPTERGLVMLGGSGLTGFAEAYFFKLATNGLKGVASYLPQLIFLLIKNALGSTG
jgi:hypothetical protein